MLDVNLICVLKRRAQSKVNQIHFDSGGLCILRNTDVLRLDVPMDVAYFMQSLDLAQQLKSDIVGVLDAHLFEGWLRLN